MQETHSDERYSRFWQNEWGGQAIFSHGDNRSKGVAIFFSPSLRVKLINTATSDSGRYVIAVAEIDGTVCTLICSYGPNTDDPNSFENLVRDCDNIRSGDIIWGGDFNFCMNMSLDRLTTSQRPRNNDRCRQTVLEYMQSNSLLDIWRVLNPDRREYTCLRSNPVTKSRIDFFLISDTFLQDAVRPEACIRNGYLSDHQMVTLDVRIRSSSFGRSYWKFNNSLLLDELFVTEARSKINEIMQDNAQTESACLLLQTVLCVLRGWIIQFATHRKKEKNKKLVELQKDIDAIESQTVITQDQEESLSRLKDERESIIYSSTERGIISCKARWRHAAERGTAYFHGLNKRNHTGNFIKALNLVYTAPDETTDDVPKMLEECRFYYDRLYAARPFKACPNDFLSEIKVNVLNDTERSELDAPLTAEELKASLDSMSGSTSPGPDGYTVSFYKVFWEELGPLVFDAVSECYSELVIPQNLRNSITVLIP